MTQEEERKQGRAYVLRNSAKIKARARFLATYPTTENLGKLVLAATQLSATLRLAMAFDGPPTIPQVTRPIIPQTESQIATTLRADIERSLLAIAEIEQRHFESPTDDGFYAEVPKPLRILSRLL